MSDHFLLADVMASGIHDVRNYLFTAESNLLDTSSNAETAREMILAAAARLNRMLTAYQLLRHEQRLAMNPTSIRDLLEDAVLQAAETSSRKIPTSVDLAYGDDWVLSREEIGDVLVNALQNASRFAERRIEIATRIDNEALRIEIHDDGPGFPESPAPGRQDNKGHGIGLFIARQVARHHSRQRGDRLVHGDIALGTSHRLGGALFTLQLP